MPRVARSGFAMLLAVCAIVLLTTSLQAQQRQALAIHVSAPTGAKLVGHLPTSQQMNLALTLPLHNQDQLQILLQQLDDPTSPNYHQYLTATQFTEQFAPTVAEYQHVIGFAQVHGFTVTHTSSSRMLLNVTGSVANVEQAFQITMQVYQHPTENRTFYAPNVEPSADSGIPLLGVSGLTNFTLPHSMLRRASSDGGVPSDQTGSGPGGQFYGSDMRAAYYGTGPLTGSGQALALAELGQWNMADIQAYFSSVNQTLSVPIVTELLGGTSGVCPGDCDDGEQAVDIQQIISMAPGASVLIVYEDTSGNDDVDIFDAYSTDNIAKQMSFSFGIGDGNAASDEQYFAKFHAQGQNFFVASGDAGPYVGTSGWPGYSQNVTDVGGTDLTTASAGGAWSSEVAWVGSGSGWCNNNVSGSPCDGNNYGLIPSYQQATGVINASNQGSTTFRNIVDVSAEANTDNFWCSSGTCQGGIGGTSLAAPRWAGFLALANEQAASNGETIGFLNPTVYAIGQGSSYLHDITTGWSENSSLSCTVGALGCLNGSQSGEPSGVEGFNAIIGYDLATGWGTPDGPATIAALAPTSTTNPYFTLSASPSTLPLTPGGADQNSAISLTAENGFTGTVTLSANILGAPAGVTASFNPASISGSETSTLTVSTTSGSPSGTLMLVVTGTSSGGIQTQPAFVTLALPDFYLSVTPSPTYPGQPNDIYINQGATAASTVTVNSQNNFSGTVNLSVNSLPSGVTGSFSPASTGSTSTLTLTASSTATTVGSDYLTVSGTSGAVAPLNAPYTILSVSAATGTGGSGTPVTLNSAYNLAAIYADGVTFGTGLDGAGNGYSSNLLTANRILSGVQFSFGPANTTNCGASSQPGCVNDAVSSAGQTITLPSGQFTTLQMLATGIDGPVLSQTITVTYTDGTTSAFTQSFSDWCSCSKNPGQQPGESFAVSMPYRDEATGVQDNTAFNLYAYTFVLNSAKTVKNVTLPQPRSGNVVVLAATLSAQSLGTQVSLSSAYNIAGIFGNGVKFEGTGDIDGTANTDSCTLSDGCSDAYSEQQLGMTSATSPTLTIKGTTFNFGPVNTANCGTGLPACVSDIINLPAGGLTIPLPSNQQTAYTTLTMLGTAVNGSQTGTVTVTYTTGSAALINQTFSDWCNFTGNSNESIAVGGISRINSDGTLATGASCNLYSYTYTLDSTRTVQSITLTYTGSSAPGEGAFVLALTLSGNSTSPPPSYSISAATASPASITPGGTSTATVTVTSAGGYTGSVTLSCAVTSTVTFTSSQASCSFGNTSPVTISTGSGTATLTFSTAASSAAMLSKSMLPKSKLRKSNAFYALWLPIPGLALICLGRGSQGSRRKKPFSFLFLWMILASLIVLPSCGSGGGSGGGGTGGTPAGTYTITITGTDANGLTQSNAAPTVTVVVN
jgi:hypothetical protein